MRQIYLKDWDRKRPLEFRTNLDDPSKIFVDGRRVVEETQIINEQGILVAYDTGSGGETFARVLSDIGDIRQMVNTNPDANTEPIERRLDNLLRVITELMETHSEPA